MPQTFQKQDVSSKFASIPIDAKDSLEAAEIIMQTIHRLRFEGWTIGTSVAKLTTEGTTEYQIENITNKATIKFDLRPTLLRGVSVWSLAIHTLGVGSIYNKETLKQLRDLQDITAKTDKRDSGLFGMSERSKWILFLVIILTLAILIVIFMVTMGFTSVFKAIFNL